MTTPWPEVALGDVAVIERRVRAPEDIGSGSLYVGLEHIERGGEIIGVTPVENGELASAKFDFTEEHILFGKLRPYLAKIALPDFRGVCSTDILPVLVGPYIDRTYLCRFLRQPTMVDFATSRSVGANLPRLSPAELARFPIPLPPIEEQRRIAAVLDQADELRAKRRASLALLDSLTESIFLEVAASGSAWPAMSIEALAADRPHSIRTGPFGSQLLHSEFVGDGIAVLGIDNAVQDRFVWARPRFISHEKFEHLRRYQVLPGDVLITIMGTCGRCAVVPADVPVAINTKHLCCITLNTEKCLPEYLWSSVKYHRGVRRQLGATTRGAVMPGLNMGLIKSAEIPVPPIEVQRSFTACLAQTRQVRASVGRSEAEVSALFASLQHRAFTGAL